MGATWEVLSDDVCISTAKHPPPMWDMAVDDDYLSTKSGRLTTPPPTLGAPRGQRCSL